MFPWAVFCVSICRFWQNSKGNGNTEKVTGHFATFQTVETFYNSQPSQPVLSFSGQQHWCPAPIKPNEQQTYSKLPIFVTSGGQLRSPCVCCTLIDLQWRSGDCNLCVCARVRVCARIWKKVLRWRERVSEEKAMWRKADRDGENGRKRDAAWNKRLIKSNHRSA